MASEAETNHFMLSEHVLDFQYVCRELGCYISVRLAGEHTLNRLREGYAAKGHDIDDKSIKPSSLEKAKITNHTPFEPYFGFVGHWGENRDDLRGVRTVTKWRAVEVTKIQKKRVVIPFSGMKSKEVTQVWDQYEWEQVSREERFDNYVKFADLEKVGKPPVDAYTGDYDLHDVIMKGAGVNKYFRGTSTPEHEDIHNMLFTNLSNEGIALKAKKLALAGHTIGIGALLNRRIKRMRNAGFGNETRKVCDWFGQVVQHGPQHGFPAFALTREKDKWVHSLVDFDPPILVFDPKGEMMILRSVDTIRKHLYERAGCVISPWWEQNHQIKQAYEYCLSRLDLKSVPIAEKYNWLKKLRDCSKGMTSIGSSETKIKHYGIWQQLRESYIELQGQVGGLLKKDTKLETILELLEKLLKQGF